LKMSLLEVFSEEPQSTICANWLSELSPSNFS
jgi:hypothetical protein